MDYWLILLHGSFTNFCINFIFEQFTGLVLILQITLLVSISSTYCIMFSFTIIRFNYSFRITGSVPFFSFTVSGSHDYSLFLDQFLKSD